MKQVVRYVKVFWILFVFLVTNHGFAQQESALENINRLIYNDSVDTANNQLQQTVLELKSNKDFKQLADYIYPLGTLSLIENPATDFKEVLDLYQLILGNTKDNPVLYKSNLSLASLYDNQGQAKKAYDLADKAHTIATESKDIQSTLESGFYLSEYGMKQGDFNLLFKHTDDNLKILQSNTQEKFPLAPRIYNYKASIMHFTSKPDSANYYFEKALAHIDDLEDNPENKYYLPATIYGNWFMVKQTAGDYETAMDFSLKSAALHHTFLKNTKNHPLTSRVHGNLSIAYRNLGSLYNDLGDKTKFQKFAGIGYRHAKRNFLPNTMSYFTAMLMMAESRLYSGLYDDALIFLKEAEESLAQIEGPNYTWHAQINHVLGDVWYKKQQHDVAISFYEKASVNYTKSNDEGFSINHFYALINLAKSYGKIGEHDLALAKANLIYEYAVKNYGEDSYMANAGLLSIIEVSYLKGDYETTIKYADNSLNIFDGNKDPNVLNKFYFEENKADILLYKTKAQFRLMPKKNVETLKELNEQLQLALDNIGSRKSIITSHESINHLIANNSNIIEFAKILNLELYELTNNQVYLERILSLNESSIYNRIRARLNLKEVKISNVPEVVLQREAELKDLLNAALDESQEEDIGLFTKHLKEWNGFKDSLMTNYPKYYKMRYASIEQSLENLYQDVPNLTSLVRYLFIDDQLFAYVLNDKENQLVKLDFEVQSDLITKLSNYKSDFKTVASASHQLYNQLWKPLEHIITNENVIIFPDGDLYNLSFELLTREPISSYTDFATHSLLSNHNISYNYSLLLLKNENVNTAFENDFVAFAPEFNQKMKQDYELAITDSINLDKTYLTLLPQPFSVDLAKRFSERFKGSSFLNEKASKQVFSNSAKEHKIIHIGTHAENNNTNPELSRLIFAKNSNDSTLIDDNSLYTFEIYNYNLSSDLAILTACETGKPSYQPGEGMISLAHAFNYAGSRSILTSLWELDEQASTEILSYFYENLEDGLTKDQALKNAKLEYISRAEGRTAHPQYWGGLILMGDIDPISITASKPRLLWVGMLAGVLLVFGVLYFRFKRSKQ